MRSSEPDRRQAVQFRQQDLRNGHFAALAKQATSPQMLTSPLSSDIMHLGNIIRHSYLISALLVCVDT